VHVRWLIPAGAAVAHVAVAAQYMTVDDAQKAAFPAATQFVPVALADTTAKVFDARNGDVHLGFLIVDQVIGKSEMITYSLALDANGAVLALEILDYRESHGGEVRLAGWRRQFIGKTAAEPPAFNRDIKNISGATLSCRHLTEGVQRLLQLYQRSLAKA
jgi:Na+-translocating ferredoxin:NAD+ oxidoreductase RnfG subunit